MRKNNSNNWWKFCQQIRKCKMFFDIPGGVPRSWMFGYSCLQQYRHSLGPPMLTGPKKYIFGIVRANPQWIWRETYQRMAFIKMVGKNVSQFLSNAGKEIIPEALLSGSTLLGLEHENLQCMHGLARTEFFYRGFEKGRTTIGLSR